MALTDLGNGTGKIYQVKPSGAIDTYPNTAITLRNILISATGSRIIYEAQSVDTFDFTDPVYGSTYWFNDSGAAPVGSIVGAMEVTDYFIVDTRNDAQQGDIVAGSYTVTRRSRITIIPLVPETGTSDDLIALAGDLLVGDLVILLPKGGGSEYTITIKDKEAFGVTGGNFKLHNDQDIVLTGTNDVCLFIKNSDSIKEIARPDSQLLSVANKTLSSAGGTYYVLDPSGGAARVKSKRGLVVLQGGGSLASSWSVWGENGGDTSISQGTTLDIILEGGLITSSYDGAVLTIFGVAVPDILAKYANFMVRAWYDDSDADPLNWDWRAVLITEPLPVPEAYVWGHVFNPGGSGIDYMFEPVSVGESSTNASYTISPSFNQTICKVNMRGILEMNDNVSAGNELIVGDNCVPGLMSLEDLNFPCYLMQPDGTPIGICIVVITSTATIFPSTFVPSKMKVIAISTPISIGDYIDLAPVQYYAEL
jgi:hypothetical protein